jgi:hypothetical protein
MKTNNIEIEESNVVFQSPYDEAKELLYMFYYSTFDDYKKMYMRC